MFKKALVTLPLIALPFVSAQPAQAAIIPHCPKAGPYTLHMPAMFNQKPAPMPTPGTITGGCPLPENPPISTCVYPNPCDIGRE